MITYRQEKEREIALHYAIKLNDTLAKDIIEKSAVTNKSEALHLAEFFWRMVDACVDDMDKKQVVCGELNLEPWNEFTMNSFRSYLRSAGYADEWEQATDQAWFI